MTTPLPAWRIYGEQGPELVIEVDLPDLDHAYITVREDQFDTPLMAEMIRAVVTHRTKTIGDVRAGGG